MRRYVSLSPYNLFVWVNLVLIKGTGLTVLIAAVSFHENKSALSPAVQDFQPSLSSSEGNLFCLQSLFLGWSARQADVTGQFDNILGKEKSTC